MPKGAQRLQTQLPPGARNPTGPLNTATQPWAPGTMAPPSKAPVKLKPKGSAVEDINNKKRKINK